MQQQGALAYQQVARQTEAPRDREANLLSRAASRLQLIRDSWDENRTDLQAALQFNRKLWSFFMTSVTNPENPLPDQIRQNIANLGIFVVNHSMKVATSPEPQKLDVLININRQIAAGLRATPATR